jgi:hypothetical protein
MKYLKTYENFFKKVKNVLNKIIDPSDTKDYKASWNMHEIPVLQKYSKISTCILHEDTFEYYSTMTNLSIKIKKTYVEEVVGYAPATFKVTVSNDKGAYSKTYTDFNDVKELMEKLIPQEEIDANKYNL